MKEKKPALFLDRDGVVNKNHGYVFQIEKFEFYPEIFEICQLAISAGLPIVIITNQSGIGRGLFSESDYRKLTAWMISQFQINGIVIDDVIHAPENPETAQGASTGRRKPSPAMFLEAADKHNIHLQESLMIGDNESDMISALNAGVKHRILIGQPNDRSVASDWVEDHDNCVRIVKAIVARIRE